jgi:hypothetical protein
VEKSSSLEIAAITGFDCQKLLTQASKVQASRWDARFTLLCPAIHGRAKVKRPAGTNAEILFLEFYSNSPESRPFLTNRRG